MTTSVLNNFVNGKIDKDLDGRIDSPFYTKGFPVFKNWKVDYKGNLRNRTGTDYVSETRNNQKARLFEFKFNDRQSYLIEATDNWFRFYTYDSNGNFGYVLDSNPRNEVPTMTSNNTNGFISSDSRNSADVFNVFNGVTYKHIGAWPTYWLQMKYPTNKILKRYAIKADSSVVPEYPSKWILQGSKDSISWNTINTQDNQSFGLGQERFYDVPNNTAYMYYRIQFLNGNGAIGEIGRVQFFTFNENPDLLELNTAITYEYASYMQYAQNADVMYLTDMGFSPKKLTRTGAVNFNIASVSATGLNFTELGNPQSCSFYKGRLYYGGFIKKPTTIKGSKVIDYDQFTIPTTNIKDDDALSLSLSDISMPISWIRGGKRNLIVGNPEGITVINGGSSDEPITSTKVNADLANKQGSNGAYPIEKDGVMIYIDNDGKSGYGFDYDFVSESFLSQDLNLLSKSVIKGRIKELYYKNDKDNLIYCLMDNGQLICLLYNKAENIVGWLPLETNGYVNSMCTITKPDSSKDLFMQVYRNGINYIEKVSDEIEITSFYDTDFINDTKGEKYRRLVTEDMKRWNYIDCSSTFTNLKKQSITLNNNVITSISDVFSLQDVGHRIVFKTKTGEEYGAMLIKEYVDNRTVNVEVLSGNINPQNWEDWYITFNTITDLDDVNGLFQSVFADGGYIGDFEVVDGKIELGKEYTYARVGYSYTSLLKTFNLGAFFQGVNLQTRKKNITKFVVRLNDSAGVIIGTSVDNLAPVQKYSTNGFYDTPPLPLNGDTELTGYGDSFNKEKSIYLGQDLPLPMNLTMLQYDMELGD